MALIPHCLTRSFDGLKIGVLDPKEWHLPDYMAVPNEVVDNEIVRYLSILPLPILEEGVAACETRDADVKLKFRTSKYPPRMKSCDPLE